MPYPALLCIFHVPHLSASLLSLEAFLGPFQLNSPSQMKLAKAGLPFPARWRTPPPPPTRLASSVSGSLLLVLVTFKSQPTPLSSAQTDCSIEERGGDSLNQSINKPISLPAPGLSVPRHFSLSGVWVIRRKKEPLHKGDPILGFVMTH